MKNSNKILKNFLWYGVLQIVNILVGFVLPRLYLKIFGSEVNGVISTINNFISYFAYVEAGLGLTLMYSLFKPLAEKNYDSINNVVTTAKKSYFKISAIYFCLVVGLTIIFPLLSKDTTLSFIEFALLILVIGLYGALDYFFMAKYRVLLTADQKEYVISIAMAIAQLVRFILTFLLLQIDGISVVLAKCAPIITIFLRTLILKVYVKKKYPQVTFKSTGVEKIDIKNNYNALLMQIGISLNISFPAIIVSQISGYMNSSVFSVYHFVVSTVISLISIFSSGIAPTLGKKMSRGENVTNAFEEYSHFINIIIQTLFVVTIILFVPFIKIYTSVVSDIEYVNLNYAILFVIFGVTYASRIPYTAVINASGLYKENQIHSIINIAFLIISSIILTYFFAIVGALIAAIITAIHRNISMLFVCKNKIKFNWFKILFNQIFSIAIVILVHILINYVIDINVLINDFGKLFIAGIIGLLCSAIIVVLINVLLDMKSSKSLFKRVKKIIFRR